MNGHCEHCATDARGKPHLCDDWRHSNGKGAKWDDGCCAACAERERIADAIAEAAGPPDDGASRGPVGDAVLDTYLHCWTIANNGGSVGDET